MIANDYRFMQQGKHLFTLSQDDLLLIKPIKQCNKNHINALLLLHGFSSTPAVFRYLIPHISKYDAIICPKLNGHGESMAKFSQTTTNNWRKTAYDSCEDLVKHYKYVDVLGLSLGGLLACELSQQFKLRRLFLLAPALKLKIPIAIILKIVKLLNYMGFDSVRNFAGNFISTKYFEIAYRRLPLIAVIEILSLILNFKWVAPTCATEVFLGAKDQIIDSLAVAELFYPLSNAKIHWLQNSAHILPLDNDANYIINYLNMDFHYDKYGNPHLS